MSQNAVQAVSYTGVHTACQPGNLRDFLRLSTLHRKVLLVLAYAALQPGTDGLTSVATERFRPLSTAF